MGDTSVERFSGDEPHFKEPQPPRGGRAKLACLLCGSPDTELLHETGGGSIIGAWHELEVRCRACGKCSAEITDYES